MKVSPATVRVPERVTAELFGATVYVTVWLPLPEAPWLMAIQLALLLAVHEAFATLEVTAILLDPPAAEKLAEVALSENTGFPAGAMLTGSRIVRETPPLFAAIVKL